MLITNPTLVVDNDLKFLEELRLSFKEINLKGEFFADVPDAINAIRSKSYAGAVLDLRIAEDSGLRILSSIYDLELTIPVIMISSYRSLSGAVAALKLGAKDYLLKPVTAEQIKRSLYTSSDEQPLMDFVIDQNEHLDDINVGDPISLEAIENEHIRKVVEREGSIAKAARVLKVNRSTLFRKKHVWSE